MLYMLRRKRKNLPENNKDIDSASDSFISENITNSEYLIIYNINGKKKTFNTQPWRQGL